MEISGASSAAASTTVAIEVQKKTQDLQKETAASLIEALPQVDPASSLGQNINVTA